MANIKLGNNTLTGVSTIKCENADSVGQYVSFGAGIQGGYTVTFKVNNIDYIIQNVQSGGSISEPPAPTVSGYSFMGWYSGSSKISFPYTPSADVTLTASLSANIVIGFTGLTNYSGTLTYTDDIASYSAPTPETSGNYINVTSQLDSVFPFNEITEYTDSEGNIFVKYPKMWMKWVEDANGYIDGVKFSNNQVDSSYFISDAYLKTSDGTTYGDWFALGKYEASGSTSKIYSKSGQTCIADVTRPQSRTAARAYGTSSNYYNGYQLQDLAQLTLYNLLCMLYYKTANIQTIYAGRTGNISSWSGPSITGTCDGLVGRNGWNNTTECVKMLGIENPYSNINKWIDGVYFSSQSIYCHRRSHQYADSTSYATALGFNRPSSGGFISKLKHGTVDATRSYMYCAEASGSSSTYVGDYCYYTSSGVVLCAGGSWGGTSGAGLWRLDGDYDASNSNSNIGCRLSLKSV